MSYGILVSLAFGLGCSSPKTDSASSLNCTTINNYDVTWSNWGQGFFMTWCQSCHSATANDRHGAPENSNFDTEQQVMLWKERIIARVITAQTMPIGGGLSSEDLELLERYFNNVSCP